MTSSPIRGSTILLFSDDTIFSLNATRCASMDYVVNTVVGFLLILFLSDSYLLSFGGCSNQASNGQAQIISNILDY